MTHARAAGPDTADTGATPTATRRSIAVLMGGPSAEHDVSLVSGRAIAGALAERGHEVTLWLIGLDGSWWRLPPAAGDRSLPQTMYDEPAGLGAEGPLTAASGLGRLAAETPRPVMFIALHGPFGEDGTVQALCEAADLVYTGPGVAASAVGMDKALFKRLVGALGLPVAPWREVDARSYGRARDRVLEDLARFAAGLPDTRLIVKPSRLGSSIGISIVHRPADPGELGRRLDEAFVHDDLAIVEAYLAAARELEASVVGNGPADVTVYGPGEIFPGREFYDYEAKYRSSASRTTDRPDLPDAVREEVRTLAREAYLAVGAVGFSRVDFLYHGGRVYLSEINTIPGFTPISLFPVLCAEGGYDFGGISERIVELAVERAVLRPSHRLTRADLP